MVRQERMTDLPYSTLPCVVRQERMTDFKKLLESTTFRLKIPASQQPSTSGFYRVANPCRALLRNSRSVG